MSQISRPNPSETRALRSDFFRKWRSKMAASSVNIFINPQIITFAVQEKLFWSFSDKEQKKKHENFFVILKLRFASSWLPVDRQMRFHVFWKLCSRIGRRHSTRDARLRLAHTPWIPGVGLLLQSTSPRRFWRTSEKSMSQKKTRNREGKVFIGKCVFWYWRWGIVGALMVVLSWNVSAPLNWLFRRETPNSRIRSATH